MAMLMKFIFCLGLETSLGPYWPKQEEVIIKFRYSEKATKTWKNPPLFYTFLGSFKICFFKFCDRLTISELLIFTYFFIPQKLFWNCKLDTTYVFGRVFLLIGFPLSGGSAAAAGTSTSWLCHCAASSFCGPHLATGCFFERQ